MLRTGNPVAHKVYTMETASSTISLKWIESYLMTAVDSRGSPLVIGSTQQDDLKWNGVKPSDLLLLSAAACSTYDVTMILKKQREPLVSLDVRCTGEQEVDPPYKFVRIHLRYILRGDLNPDKVARAIQLSEEKYCSVTNTLRSAVEITSDFVIEPGNGQV
jgi:putative redox protein